MSTKVRVPEAAERNGTEITSRFKSISVKKHKETHSGWFQRLAIPQAPWSHTYLVLLTLCNIHWHLLAALLILPPGFVDPRALNSSRKRFRITTAFIPLCFEARIWYKYAKCPGSSICCQQKPSTEVHETHRLLGTTLKKLHHCLWVGLGGKVAVSSYPVSKTMGLSFYHPLLETPNW